VAEDVICLGIRGANAGVLTIVV